MYPSVTLSSTRRFIEPKRAPKALRSRREGKGFRPGTERRVAGGGHGTSGADDVGRGHEAGHAGAETVSECRRPGTQRNRLAVVARKGQSQLALMPSWRMDQEGVRGVPQGCMQRPRLSILAPFPVLQRLNEPRGPAVCKAPSSASADACAASATCGQRITLPACRNQPDMAQNSVSFTTYGRVALFHDGHASAARRRAEAVDAQHPPRAGGLPALPHIPQP